MALCTVYKHILGWMLLLTANAIRIFQDILKLGYSMIYFHTLQLSKPTRVIRTATNCLKTIADKKDQTIQTRVITTEN